MRKIMVLVLVVALAVPSLNARKPRDRAGDVTDGVYTDKKYKFQMTMSEGWKYKIQDSDSRARLVLTQVTYDIPPQFNTSPEYTKIPAATVYVDTTSLGAPAFIDSLVSETFESKQKKEILKEFEILTQGAGGVDVKREPLIPRQRKYINIGEGDGFLWTGTSKYRTQIAKTTADDETITRGTADTGAKRVYGGLGGGVIGVKNGDIIVLVHVICEEDYFDNVLREITDIVNTLKWTE